MYSAAVQIAKTLQIRGYQAYFAGGYVRDLILGKEQKDIDIATNATPDQIESIFSNTYPVGKKFGVILVQEDTHHFEIATFRSDSGYSDGRRPDFVTFTNVSEDAKRRDFTINGMFYDPLTEKILDFVDGQRDLAARVIRFIGNPTERLKEDHLRLLRAVRFAHQIDGAFDPKTYAALKKHAPFIQKVSSERIQQEMTKILAFPTRARALEDLQDLGLLHYILPEIELLKGIAQPKIFHQEGSVWDHAMLSIASLSEEEAKDSTLIWATLLHDVGKPATFSVDVRIRYNGHAEISAQMANDILQRFKFPKKFTEKICWAIQRHMSLEHLTDPNISELTKRRLLTHPDFPFLLALHKADVSGTIPADFSLYDEIKKLYSETMQSLPKVLPKLISGDEIMNLLQIDRGKYLGEIIQQIKDWQLLGEVHTKTEVIERLQKKIKP